MTQNRKNPEMIVPTSKDTALGTESIGKLLFKLSVPAIAAQFVNMLYNIVDRIYIGHIAGEGAAALTGVGVCMPLIMIVSSFAALVSSGGAPREHHALQYSWARRKWGMRKKHSVPVLLRRLLFRSYLPQSCLSGTGQCFLHSVQAKTQLSTRFLT